MPHKTMAARTQVSTHCVRTGAVAHLVAIHPVCPANDRSSVPPVPRCDAGELALTHRNSMRDLSDGRFLCTASAIHGSCIMGDTGLPRLMWKSMRLTDSSRTSETVSQTRARIIERRGAGTSARSDTSSGTALDCQRVSAQSGITPRIRTIDVAMRTTTAGSTLVVADDSLPMARDPDAENYVGRRLGVRRFTVESTSTSMTFMALVFFNTFIRHCIDCNSPAP